MRGIITLLILTVLISVAVPARGEEGNFSERGMEQMVIDYLIHHIEEKTGLEVEIVRPKERDVIELMAVKGNDEGLMIMKVKGLSLHSSDVMTKPLTANLVIELLVLDSVRNEVYFKRVIGRYEITLEALMHQLSEKELAEAIASDALSQYAEDPELRKIIAKLKYGALGNLVGML